MSPLAPPGGETNKFKLKPKAAEPALAPPPSSAGRPAVALPANEPSPAAEPPPIAKRPAAAPGTKPKIPHLRGPEGEVPDILPIPPVQRRAFKIGVVGVLAAVVVVFGGGAYVAYRFLRQPAAPSPAPKTAPAVSKPAPAAAAADPIGKIGAAVSLPGKMVEKAQGAVAARRGNEQARIDAFAAGEEAPEQRALNTPPPSTFVGTEDKSGGAARSASTENSATTTIAPGISATTSDVVAAEDASPAFRSWVANVKISGVFQAATPRALINGRTVRVGQTIDEALGIVFDGIDPQAKEITFRDGTGAKVSRKY